MHAELTNHDRPTDYDDAKTAFRDPYPIAPSPARSSRPKSGPGNRPPDGIEPGRRSRIDQVLVFRVMVVSLLAVFVAVIVTGVVLLMG